MAINHQHSEYAKKLAECKKRVVDVQNAIKFEKQLISYFIKNTPDSKELIKTIAQRIGLLRRENKYLSEEIIDIRGKIKTTQRFQNTPVDYFNLQPMKYRMYSMVLRQLNPMQKGIQSLHAVVEYSEKVKTFSADYRQAYSTWAHRDKTMIILDAGTSVDLINATHELIQLNIPHAVFYEEDLYGMNTVVCFLADERVWDTKKYPSYEEYVYNFVEENKFRQPSSMAPPKEWWIEKVFNNIDPTNILRIRDLIFSKKLSM